MLPELTALRQRYIQCRSDLRTAINDLPDQTFQWVLVPDMMTIGSHVLHILGYEVLLISVLTGYDAHEVIASGQWRPYLPGFYRELDRPQQFDVTHALCMKQLDEIGDLVPRFLESLTQTQLESNSCFFAHEAAFKNVPLVEVPNRVLVLTLLYHQEYHRGQVRLMCFLWRETSKHGQ